MELANHNHRSALDLANLPSGRAVVVGRERASGDSYTSTAQTVRRMCELIQEGASDSAVRAIAARAWERYGSGIDLPAAKCWAVFWWVKHHVKFRSDEGMMLAVGETDQFDLLISPALLVRMKQPAEDCDGFTMLVAALLVCLSVPVVIATTAVDPANRSRFSHVFPCAYFNGSLLPLDASHGSQPGWMVPTWQISRWQTWGLDGRPVNLSLDLAVRDRGVGAWKKGAESMYVSRRRGVGEYHNFGMGDYADEYALDAATRQVLIGTAAAPSTSGNWGGFLQSLIQQGVTLTGQILRPPDYAQTTRDASGALVSTTVRNATPSTALTAAGGGFGTNSSSILWIGGGLLALVAVASLAKK